MATDSDNITPDMTAHLTQVLGVVSGVTGFDIGGAPLLKAYLPRLIDQLGADATAEMLQDTATYIDLTVHSGYPNASANLAARHLVPGADVNPPGGEATKLLPVTELAVTIGRDLRTVATAAADIADRSATSLGRLLLPARVLLRLHAQLGDGCGAMLDDAAATAAGNRRATLEARRSVDPRDPTAVAAPAATAAFPTDLTTAIADDWKAVTALALETRAAQEPQHALRAVPEPSSDPSVLISDGAIALADTALGTDGHVPSAAEQADTLDSFLAISVALSGMHASELQGTGQVDAYLATLTRAAGTELTTAFIRRGRGVIETGVHDREALETSMRVDLLADQRLGVLARSTAKVWFTGSWDAPTPDWYAAYAPDASPPPPGYVVSAEAYKSGFGWTIAGGHAQGARQPGFGSWALPPQPDPSLHTSGGDA